MGGLFGTIIGDQIKAASCAHYAPHLLEVSRLRGQKQQSRTPHPSGARLARLAVLSFVSSARRRPRYRQQTVFNAASCGALCARRFGARDVLKAWAFGAINTMSGSMPGYCFETSRPFSAAYRKGRTRFIFSLLTSESAYQNPLAEMASALGHRPRVWFCRKD